MRGGELDAMNAREDVITGSATLQGVQHIIRSEGY